MTTNPKKTKTAPTKDSLRAAMLGKQHVFMKKTYKLDGQEIEVRQPTVGGRAKLMKKCEKDVGKGTRIDMAEFMVYSVIFNCYVPGTNEHIFSEEDFDALMGMPSGSFIDDLSELAAEMSNVSVAPRKKS